jgi:hypothetical protein
MKLFPGKWIGVAALPQTAGDPVQNAIPELERCVKQLGSVGCLLNPDPYENSGTEAPPLGDRYWYPLYEKLCELDVPAHVHGTGSRSERSPYPVHFINEESIAVFGLVNSNVFNDFPNLGCGDCVVPGRHEHRKRFRRDQVSPLISDSWRECRIWRTFHPDYHRLANDDIPLNVSFCIPLPVAAT